MVVSNIIVMILETFEQLSAYNELFRTFEIVCVVFFIIEYALRIWTAPLLYPELTRTRAVWKFMKSYDGVIDLFTILPFFFLSGAVVFRMLRVVRIFHLFRINTNYDSFNVITSVLKNKKNQIFSSLFILLLLLLAASLCMYSAEHDAQPDVFDNAFSALWWSISTVLTIGYGDIYPITIPGKILAVIISILGVGVVAIPTGIISAGFVEQYNIIQKESRKGKGTIALNVTPGSGIEGLSVVKLWNDFGIAPLVIIRDGTVVIPTDDITIKIGDTLVYYEDPV